MGRRTGQLRLVAHGTILGGVVALSGACHQTAPSVGAAVVDAGFASAPSTPPAFGETTTLANSPPAISGGTLLIAADGHTAVAADSDRDAVFVVDLTATPYLHSGCAPTLFDRFNPTLLNSDGYACAGADQHGHWAQLTTTQINDLVAYLQSL